MNFLRGFADGMDFYRDDKNKASVLRFLGEYYKSNNIEELEETRRVYTKIMPRLPIVTTKSLENIISNDRTLMKMNVNVAEILGPLEGIRAGRRPRPFMLSLVAAASLAAAVSILVMIFSIVVVAYGMMHS